MTVQAHVDGVARSGIGARILSIVTIRKNPAEIINQVYEKTDFLFLH